MEREFVLIDCLRPVLWNNPHIAWYYRQNLFLYAQEDRVSQYPKLSQYVQNPPEWTLKILHPGMYEGLIRTTDPHQMSLKIALKNFLIAAGAAIERKSKARASSK